MAQVNIAPVEVEADRWTPREVAMLDALSYAIGFIEGLGHEAPYPKRVLDHIRAHLTEPQYLLVPPRDDAA